MHITALASRKVLSNPTIKRSATQVVLSSHLGSRLRYFSTGSGSQIPPKKGGKSEKFKGYALSIMELLVGCGGILALGKLLDGIEKKVDSKKVFKAHVAGQHVDSKIFLDAAIQLNLYQPYAKNGKPFFRGELLNQEELEEIQKTFSKEITLEKNKPISESITVAQDFTNEYSPYKIIKRLSRREHAMPVIYEVKIPKNVKFIRVPKEYAPIDEAGLPIWQEKEYVLLEGTKVRFEKSIPPKDADPDVFYITMHVLADGQEADK